MTSSAQLAHQPTLEDWGTPLSEVTFVVLDLETTGSGPEDTITEIGAVKVRAGEVVSEFATLVNPHTHIPALIAVLTGITNQMVADAPPLRAVLPGLLEYLRGCVLVAHNARFDVGFLKRSCERFEQEWTDNIVVDTVALARCSLLSDEVRNCKLSTLAEFFRASTTPTHRALDDARATVDVLHGLLERVGNLGVNTLEDLVEFTRKVSPQRRAKRVWSQDLPATSGVYWFWSDFPDDAGGTRREVLYVGKSTNLKQRVRSYFTAAEKRGRMEEMIRVAQGVGHIVCETALEAEVRELRLIASHQPRYNRRSRRQHKVHWVKLTREAFPRLSVVSKVGADGAHYWGPFSSSQSARDGRDALYDAFPVRRCTARLSPTRATSACALAEMGRCPAPCTLGENAKQYSRVVSDLRAALDRDVRPVVRTVGSRLSRLVQQQRFEEAAEVTGRLRTYTAITRRFHRLASLAKCPQIVAARRVQGGWELHVVRHGRLAAAGFCPRDGNPQAMARDLVHTAETVATTHPWLPACSIEEAERVASWMESEGVRLIEIDGDWSWPAHVALTAGEFERLAAISPGATTPDALAERGGVETDRASGCDLSA